MPHSLDGALPAGKTLRLSWPKRLAYVAGNIGAAASVQCVSTFVLVLYLPATGQRPSLIPGVVGGVGSYLLLSLLSRGIDAFFDPWIAHRTDHSRSRFGRRRIYMLAGALPLGLSTAAMFFPPSPVAGVLNSVWLGAWLTAYFCAFSIWAAPYLALLPELAPNPRESSLLSMLQALCALLGGLLATVIAPALLLSDAADARSVQRMAVVLAAVSTFFFFLPPLAIDDAQGPEPARGATAPTLRAALAHTLRDRAFLLVVFGTNLFFFAFTLVQTGLPFFVEVLLERPLSEQGRVVGPLFLVSFAGFPAVLALSRRFGNRPVMLGATFAMALLAGAGIPLLRGGSTLAGVLLFGALGLPISAFLAVPNAMMSDVCNANVRRTGRRGEAMFFGANGFVQKLMIGAAAGAASWLMEACGKSVSSPLGVQLCGPVAALALLGAAVCFWLYPERQVTRRE